MFGVRCSMFGVERSALSVDCSPFIVRRSAFDVAPPAPPLLIPFPLLQPFPIIVPSAIRANYTPNRPRAAACPPFAVILSETHRSRRISNFASVGLSTSRAVAAIYLSRRSWAKADDRRKPFTMIDHHHNSGFFRRQLARQADYTDFICL